MKTASRKARVSADVGAAAAAVASDNGHPYVGGQRGEFDLAVVVTSLQIMRDGDFSVRLPGSWTGLGGKIADTFNDIVAANQQMARELRRVGQVVGKEGRTRERASVN